MTRPHSQVKTRAPGYSLEGRVSNSKRAGRPHRSQTTGSDMGLPLRQTGRDTERSSNPVVRLDRTGIAMRSAASPQFFGISMPGMLCRIPPPVPPRIIAMLRQHGHMPDCRCVCAGLSAIGSSAAWAVPPHIMPVVTVLPDDWACWPPPHIIAVAGVAAANNSASAPAGRSGAA